MAANPIESLILKATDESLVSDNWEYIIDVCDCVNDDPDNGAANAIKALNDRLKINNANILLRSLSLLLSLAENCGSKMKQEISSLAFTGELYLIIDNRHIHYTIKIRIVEIMQQLSKSFKSDPSLKNIDKCLAKITQNHPNLCPPVPKVPTKARMDTSDLKKEEDELQAVLKLSLDEYKQVEEVRKAGNTVAPMIEESKKPQEPNSVPKVNDTDVNKPIPNANNTNTDASVSEIKKTDKQTPAMVSKVRALYSLQSSEPGELSFEKGDVITVLESVYTDWWRGSLRGKMGIFPLNYVTPVAEQTKEEMIKDIEVEYNILQQSKNIERLLIKLQSLNTSDDPAQVLNTDDDDLIQNLYNNITPLRPQVARLIGKYSMKKEELIDLDTKLTEAERTYNDLLNAATSKYKQTSYQLPQQPTGYPAYNHNPFQHNLPQTSNVPNPVSPQMTSNVPPAYNYSTTQHQIPISSQHQNPPQHQNPVSSPPATSSSNSHPSYPSSYTAPQNPPVNAPQGHNVAHNYPTSNPSYPQGNNSAQTVVAAFPSSRPQPVNYSLPRPTIKNKTSSNIPSNVAAHTSPVNTGGASLNTGSSITRINTGAAPSNTGSIQAPVEPMATGVGFGNSPKVNATLTNKQNNVFATMPSVPSAIPVINQGVSNPPYPDSTTGLLPNFASLTSGPSNTASLMYPPSNGPGYPTSSGSLNPPKNTAPKYPLNSGDFLPRST